MIKEKQAFKPKEGKTQRALEVVAEELKNGKLVAYITNQLKYREVLQRLFRISDETSTYNLCIYCTDNIKGVMKASTGREVIVVDIGRDVTEEVREYLNDVYIYYQERAV